MEEHKTSHEFSDCPTHTPHTGCRGAAGHNYHRRQGEPRGDFRQDAWQRNNKHFHKQGGGTVKPSRTNSKAALCHQKHWRVHQKPAGPSNGDKCGSDPATPPRESLLQPHTPTQYACQTFLTQWCVVFFYPEFSDITSMGGGRGGGGALIAFL